MKMLPVQLSLNPPLGLWSDVLWRCPPAPPSQLAELKTQLPPSLPTDPRLWGREDVTLFLRFCEREFDLPKVNHEVFQMNGKALCLLTRADFGHRCPGAGDVLHNVLQMLIIESHMMHWHLPNSPVTPTSRYPLSPHSHPPTPTWPPIAPPESPFHNAHMHHFMPPNSVTLSPPPSVDSQASSPPQGQEQNASSNGSSSSTSNMNNGGVFIQNNTTSSSSNQSDSDEETFSESKAASRAAAVAAAAAVAQYNNNSPPPTPVLKDMSPSLTHQITNSFVNTWSQNQANQKMHSASGSTSSSGSSSAPTTPSYMPVKREFFPENSEPNTNGRLLWDFLQQLLNDRNQKYSDLIAWKCRDTGVFKIVDPAGLAKLWGIQKNHLSMNYDKMSRALRYYYRVNILRKVQGERHCYQFLRNPTELKNIKNISLLRQSVANSSGTGNSSTAGNVQTPATSSSSNNWPMSSQNGQGQSGQGQVQQHQQQQAVSQPSQSPQRPSSRSNNNQLGIPGNLPSASAISSSAAAAVAAAAAAYGPPPTSPLFMHAINGAFHYLTSNPQQQQQQQQQPPNSPALPTTPSEKLQFNSIKLEGNSQDGDEMKPTDLSVSSCHSSSEKRSYSQSSSSDCYPLIRNADGLTTIKLIRYNENSSPESPTHMQQCHDSSEDMQTSTMQTENCSETSNYDGNMPTDLRK